MAYSGSILREVIGLLIAMMAAAFSIVRVALDRSRAAARGAAAANAELRRSNRRLSDQMEYRRATEAKAYQTSEAKSQFLRSMSHEIRTPMIGVLGLMALLQKTTLTDRQRLMLDTVASSGRALMSVIN